MPIFQAYHGVTSQVHQQRFDALRGQGYRMISISVYGDRDEPRYAAVWVKRDGPAWVGVHGLTAAAYQAKHDELTSKGFLPNLLSVTGPRSNPLFAGTFEKGTAHACLTRFGLTDGPETHSGTLAWANKWARQNGCAPRSLAIYGTPSARAYAGVWLPNPTRMKWAVAGPMTAESYQAWFDAYTQLPFRPSQVDVSDDHRYLAMFQDDAVGPWVARHGMTAEQYQAEFDEQVSQGNMPLSVQGGGVNPIRYAAIFAKQDTAIPRKWTVTGTPVSALASFDQVMKDFMVAENVRAGSFAIVKNGVLRYARGYTWAHPEYPDTQPNSLFRLASCSKAYVCAAIHRLIEQGKLQGEQAVFPLLGITTAALPTQTANPRMDAITVNHLVDHEGGWDSTLSKFDAVFNMRKIALALGLPGRVSKRDIARYMYGEPLDFEPGAQSVYSNLGYVLLGLVVEQVTGRPFIDYLRAEILAPMDIDDVFVGGTLRSDRRPNEVMYDDPKLGKSAWDPNSGNLTAACYGGEGWVTEAMDTGGGLITTASSMARFISKHAVWGRGGRKPGLGRSGSMAGVSSLAVSRTDGIDWSYIFNTRTLSSGSLDELSAALNAVFAKVTI